jgi:hypothetical protein
LTVPIEDFTLLLPWKKVNNCRLNLSNIYLPENCNVLIAKRRSPFAVWIISFIQSRDGGFNFY